MTLSRPSTILNVRGFTLTYDDEANTVTNGSEALRQPLFGRVQSIVARREIGEWLTDWAIWKDRDNEIGIIATEAWQGGAALRKAMDLTAPVHDWSPPWVRTASMRRLPFMVTRLNGSHHFFPSWLRRHVRQALGAYQRKHNAWLIAEMQRWAEIREQSLAAFEVDQQFERVKHELRDHMNQDHVRGEVVFAVTASLNALSPRLSLRHLSFDRAGELTVEVGYGDIATISRSRHIPNLRLDGLALEEGSHVRAERAEQLGYVLSLALADLVGMLHSSRREIAIKLIDGTSDPALLLFNSRYAIGPVLGGASHIIAEVARRRRPSVSGWTVYAPQARKSEATT